MKISGCRPIVATDIYSDIETILKAGTVDDLGGSDGVGNAGAPDASPVIEGLKREERG
ncbi:hypothetical protein ThrDRAFT_01927 [Frankia casuarinae]|nr:hypothetical protein ThrDRAFT_01927 [Frankia casuarinae]KDA41295.1 hypothetical protein BMG523Draft_03883 [Frankia sp. BMG5.23]